MVSEQPAPQDELYRVASANQLEDVLTTIYLPEDLKQAVENEARRLGQSEAEVIRRAITQSVARPRPRGGLYRGEAIAERANELLSGLGER